MADVIETNATSYMDFFRIRNDWSSPWLVGLVRFMLNNRRHSESPYSAFELMFGSRDAEFFRLPDK